MQPLYSQKEIEQLCETINPLLRTIYISHGIHAEVQFSLPHINREIILNDAVWNILIKNTAIKYKGGEIMNPYKTAITRQIGDFYKTEYPIKYDKNSGYLSYIDERTMYVIYKDGTVENLCANYFYEGTGSKTPPTLLDQTPIIKALKEHFMHPYTRAQLFTNSIKHELYEKTSLYACTSTCDSQHTHSMSISGSQP
jgi:hypothetical protein